MATGSLPFGTVTLLFTDIEFSTRLLHQLGERYAGLLEDQRGILRTEIKKWNGFEVDTQGDAIFSVFPRARDAVAAAVEIQRALISHEWPEGVEVRVRIGMHTGEPMLAEEGYVGMDVHRAARIAQVGHGGQVLLSESVVALARDQLPEGIRLRDLGEHRLKDLSHSERIYQLIIPGISADFPPLTSLDTRLNNLPILLTNFVGREAEIEELKSLLNKGRLITVAGPGGVGKTRLSLQAATDQLESFEDGVWLIELASITNPELVLQTVMSIFSIHETNPNQLLPSLVEYLKDRVLLLVFDNCEHLIDACARLIDHILQRCPGVKVMVTSRETLEIGGEIVYQVPSLSIPDPEAKLNLHDYYQYEAIQLFLDRSRSVKVDFELTSKNAQTVAQICCRLDGIPLAIELAAARVKVMSVEQIADRLNDRFNLLTGGGRTVLSRHQTLQATIDWSYYLLSEREQLLFYRLAVFVGGWSLEASEAVGSGDGINPKEVLDLLAHLVNKSLINVVDLRGEARYRRLETIRHYALGKLLESGETNAIRKRHLIFFTRMAEQAEQNLVGPAQKEWFLRLDTDHDNLRAALDWSITSNELITHGLHLAGCLAPFWIRRGYLSEGRKWISSILQHPETRAPSIWRARLLAGEGQLAYLQGDYLASRTAFSESLTIFQSLGEDGQSGSANALLGLGNIDTEEGDYENAPRLFEDSLAISREIGDRRGVAEALRNLGWAAMRPGDYQNASLRLQEALKLHREIGDSDGIASCLSGLGEIAVRRGEYQASRIFLEESLEIRRLNRNQWGTAATLGTIGWAALGQMEIDHASAMFLESLEVRKDIGDKGGMAWCLEKFAEIAILTGKIEDAILIFSAASQLRTSMGSVIDPADLPDYERKLAALKSQSGEIVFNQLWEEGQGMKIDRIIETIREQLATNPEGREVP